MELIGELIKAVQDVAPELMPDCDVRKIPLIYSAAEFKGKIRNAQDKNIFVFTNYVLELHNELLAGISNILLSEIARRIKTASVLYAVQSTALAKEYPYISGVSENPVFFSEEEGEKYIAGLKENANEKVTLKKLEGEEIAEYFTRLTRFGIEYVMIEPTLCKLRYRQSELYKSDFASISDHKVSFSILKFLQAQEGKRNPLVLKGLEGAMLISVATGTFGCAGKTINGRFEAVLITDKRDGTRWIPLFTDTSEIQETYVTVPSTAKTLMTSETVTTRFNELKRFMLLDEVSGVIINLGGCGLRIEKDKCRKMMGLMR